MTYRAPRHHAMVDFPQHQQRLWVVLEEDHEKVEKERDRLQAQVDSLAGMSPDLLAILGRPCFTLIHMAQALRLMGRDIPRRAEDEQAHCLLWMLGHYLNNGAGWRETATAELKAGALLGKDGEVGNG